MSEEQQSRPFRVPHTLVLMFGMMVVALVLSWILPAGSFETFTNDHGREVVEAGTYSQLEERQRLPVWEILTVVPRAMADVQGIIFFVLIIGGALVAATRSVPPTIIGDGERSVADLIAEQVRGARSPRRSMRRSTSPARPASTRSRPRPSPTPASSNPYRPTRARSTNPSSSSSTR